MPKSSRHKSHKQSKHSSSNKEYYSGSEDDSSSKAVAKSNKDESNNNSSSSVRVNKDSSSGDKRPNAASGEQHVASKRRKDRAAVDVEGNDRWNGGDYVNVVDDSSVSNINNNNDVVKGENSLKIDSKLTSSSKGLGDAKGKSSSRRHVEEGVGMEKDESGKKVDLKVKDRGTDKEKENEKDKGDKDSRRKEVHKDVKEKDRERDKRVVDGKRNSDIGEAELKKKQLGVDGRDEEKTKRALENNDKVLDDELQKREVDKDTEKRRRRKAEGSTEKDRHLENIREADESHLSSRGERDRDGRYKDERYKEERHKDGGHRDKHRDEIDRDSRHRDGKQRDNIEREKRYRDDKPRDERASKDHTIDKYDFKYSRNENDVADSRHKKSRTENSNYDGSPVYDDRASRCKEDLDKRKLDEKEEYGDTRSRSVKEQHDLEKKSAGSDKDHVFDCGRSHSRRSDIDYNSGSSKRRSSPSSSSHATKDYRYSSEAKYRDSVREERVHATYSKEVAGGSGGIDRGYSSRSTDKSFPKDDGHLGDVSVDRRRKSDARTSPLRLVDKSPSSSSTDRRYQGKSGERRSLDFDDSGQRNNSFKDTRHYTGYEGKGNQDLPAEATSAEEMSQADGGDTMSVSSPFSRNARSASNQKSLFPPPPHRSSLDNTSNLSSYDDDNRGKSNNRFKRMGDSNMGRMQGNMWKGVPNWPSPVTNGFMPFPLGPPPVGFHPVMQQFPAPPMFNVRPSMDLNSNVVFPGHGRPFGWQHPVDESCPPPMHGWDASNGVLGDGFHMYGRLDWEHSRSIMSNGSREASVDTWKGQNDRLPMESVSTLKDDNALHLMKEAFTGPPNQQAQPQNEQSPQENQEDSNHSSGTVLSDHLAADRNGPKKEEKEISSDSQNHIDYGVHRTRAYLSKLDISADLARLDLYNQYTGLMDIGKHSAHGFNNSEIEDEDVVETRVKIASYSPCGSLFTAVGSSVFEKAMSLYKKHREGIVASSIPVIPNADKAPVPHTDDLDLVPVSNMEKETFPVLLSHPDENTPMSSVCGLSGDAHLTQETNQGNIEEPLIPPKVEVQSPVLNNAEDGYVLSGDLVGKGDEPLAVLEELKMKMDPGLNQERSINVVDEKVSAIQEVVQSPSATADNRVGKTMAQCPIATLEKMEGDLPKASAGEGMLNDGEGDGDLLMCSAPSEVCEAMKPGLNELGSSVSLSRIHHSPESTH